MSKSSNQSSTNNFIDLKSGESSNFVNILTSNTQDKLDEQQLDTQRDLIEKDNPSLFDKQFLDMNNEATE